MLVGAADLRPTRGHIQPAESDAGEGPAADRPHHRFDSKQQHFYGFGPIQELRDFRQIVSSLAGTEREPIRASLGGPSSLNRAGTSTSSVNRSYALSLLSPYLLFLCLP